MSFLSIARNNYRSLIIGLLLCLGLYLTSLYSYILFHIIAEGFSIVIAVSLFLIVWNTRKLPINNYVLFISIGFFFSGLTDFAHTLAYKGMGIFQGFDANLPTQLWIIARYIQSLSLLVAPWFIGRKLNIKSVLVSYSSLTVLLLAAVFSGTMFPDCFIEGQGLTPFKITSEYIICVILISSLALLLRHSEKFDPHILRLITWAIIFTVISEMAFTFYVSVYGLSNMIGHCFKILSFYLVYRAIIVTSLKNPYSLLFYDLQKNREEMQIIMDASPVMIFYKDIEDRFIRVNKAFTIATGLPREKIEGRRAPEIFPNQPSNYREDDREVISSGKPKTGIIESFDSASGTRWVQTDKVPYRDTDGSIIGVIGFAVDITKLKQVEEKILKMAFHDSLTGLPNRKLFSDRLDVALNQARRNNKDVAVIMLDLDNFKDVNDNLGHNAGDVLLKTAAERLRAALRRGDTVARIGGDEFVIILPDLKVVENAVIVAEKIVGSFRKPFLIDTHQLTVTTSIGIAVYPHNGKDESTLLKNADIAMYQAKQMGRNRYYVYKES